MNKLIVIGWRGLKKAYLNLSREEAVRRYCETEGETPKEAEAKLSEVVFENEFSVYDAW